MRQSIAVTVVVSLGLSSGIAFAKGNSGESVGAGSHSSAAPSAPAPAAHHGAFGPIGGGIAHNYSGSYQPVVLTANGHRTFVYPSVGNSIVQHQGHSNLNGVNTGKSLSHTGNLRSPSTVASVTKTKLDPQTSARLRNWNGKISNTAQARLNHANSCHHHHDRDWWKDHCVAFIFFDWGWWGWYDGWWYPAWGYDPYSYYEYNEPIYGYGGESPEQIVAGVQAALQQRGYYTYAIDGKMGPLTRAAIARYQSDHRLPITYGIDPATLGSLGIIH